MITDFIVGIIYMAIVFMLVRPGSQATATVVAVTNALANMALAATNPDAILDPKKKGS